MKGIRSLFELPSIESDEIRRENLLAILVGWTVILAILQLLVTLILVLIGNVRFEETLWLFPVTITMFAGLVIVILLDRSGYGTLARFLFVVLLIGVIVFGEDPNELVGGRSIFFLAIPILVSSVLLPPWTSFVAAGSLGSLLLVIAETANLTHDVARSIPFAISGFFAIALISWLTASSLERALEGLRRTNLELNNRVEIRTSELRLAQEKIVRSEKLAALGQLAGGVGHELRNPLGVISNAVYFLKSTQVDADEKMVQYLDILTEEVQNANAIINDLLDMGRSRPPEREVFTISSAMAKVLDKVPSPENVEVSWDVPDSEPAVYVDKGQTGIVFRNLVENAYQAMPEGGELKLEVASEKDRVLLRVADSGIGISEELMKKIFEPLYTTKPRGIGLGLTISKQLINANSGNIDVESKMGKGTVFTIVLPRA